MAIYLLSGGQPVIFPDVIDWNSLLFYCFCVI